MLTSQSTIHPYLMSRLHIGRDALHIHKVVRLVSMSKYSSDMLIACCSAADRPLGTMR